ncbi:hypothetical protein TIFTF001_012013 [Ficus carica]|uniref:60S acidic ribosomal protein P1 n=1 Tax=Ficus carica TaxID=3494 RepID=A0AA88A1L4_FICCA|nr:hypothetical protein TIFTF001_012013 [Ficus carica]
MSLSELACSYAVMILYDDGIPITPEKISTLVKAANVEIESYWPGLFAKLTEKRNVEDLIMNCGGSGGGAPVAAAPVAAAGGGAAAAPPPEEKKEEPKEESDDDMGFSVMNHASCNGFRTDVALCMFRCALALVQRMMAWRYDGLGDESFEIIGHWHFR